MVAFFIKAQLVVKSFQGGKISIIRRLDDTGTFTMEI